MRRGRWLNQFTMLVRVVVVVQVCLVAQLQGDELARVGASPLTGGISA